MDYRYIHCNKKWINKIISYFVYLVQYKRSQIYIVSVILIVIGFLGIINVKTTGTITDDLPRDGVLYKDLKFFEKNFGGVMPLEVIVNTKKKNGLFKSYNLRKIEKLERLLGSYSEFSRTSSYIDILKFSKQAFYNGDPDFYALPNNQEQRMIFSYLNSSKEEIGLGSFLMDSLISISFKFSFSSIKLQFFSLISIL